MARKSAAAEVLPEEGDIPSEAPPPEEAPKPKPMDGPYPKGARLFSYELPNGGGTIELPLDCPNPPDKLFFWELHQYRGRPDIQMFMWFDRFMVPKAIQRYAVSKLSDDGFAEMSSQWWGAMKGGATLGE